MFGLNQQAMLEEMQRATEASKARLEQTIVSGEAGGGLIRVEMNGNRALQSLQIRAELSMLDKEDLEDLLVVALNQALEAANRINESEMAQSAGQLFPQFFGK